jgi:ketosteroid isomerase-like protein
MKPDSAFKQLEQFYSTMQSGNFDEAMKLYATDAQVILPGQARIVGKGNIRKWWAAMLKESQFRVTPHLIEETDVGDAVVLEGKAVGQLVSKSGAPSVDIDIWFVQIYRKQPNGTFLFWRGASGANPK